MEYKFEAVPDASEKYKKLRFPLKIWILVNDKENCFIRWDKTKTIVLIDAIALERYLGSDGSIFCCSKLSTFLWLMDFNGFEPLAIDSTAVEEDPNEDNQRLLYKHASFTAENRSYFEQIFRCPELRDVIDSQNGHCSIHQPRILRNPKHYETVGSVEGGGLTSSIASAQLSSNSFAQEKFDLMMEMKWLEQTLREAYNTLADGGDDMVPIIEVPAKYCDDTTVDVPEYSKKRLIAGNYGQVELDDLKRFFGDYLPVYDDSTEAMNSTECLEEIPSISPGTCERPELSTISYSESETVMNSTNTLETFDYQEPKDKSENFEPVDHSGIPLENPSMNFVFSDEEKHQQPIEQDSECQKRLDDSQFKLGIEFRETFELLNDC
ncbi:uncharacterized protein LOC129777075 [Toxorhynchites rutilus septentrionalis]|uniref:uncharacterized protein LOC129777075 n=1 Tax=Toxorhynchites rutilus septentrionalis TaxID=329112 RepID=UPI002478BCA3|nr:uncharacterized protein LOC129777075 [Toxorhynchites rutilus septentrionalis]